MNYQLKWLFLYFFCGYMFSEWIDRLFNNHIFMAYFDMFQESSWFSICLSLWLWLSQWPHWTQSLMWSTFPVYWSWRETHILTRTQQMMTLPAHFSPPITRLQYLKTPSYNENRQKQGYLDVWGFFCFFMFLYFMFNCHFGFLGLIALGGKL